MWRHLRTTTVTIWCICWQCKCSEKSTSIRKIKGSLFRSWIFAFCVAILIRNQQFEKYFSWRIICMKKTPPPVCKGCKASELSACAEAIKSIELLTNSYLKHLNCQFKTNWWKPLKKVQLSSIMTATEISAEVQKLCAGKCLLVC